MRVTPLLVALLLLAAPSLAAAQITQPNGIVYPVDPDNGETTLLTLFNNRGEDIDWVNDASQQPNTFSPLCDFSATVVLKQSSSTLNVGWYNVTGTQPMASQIYPIFPGAVTQGMTVTGQAIRDNPNYTGGLIGFALIRASAPNYYFTERQYNPECNSGPCDDGAPAYVGRWIMSLSYQSTETPNAFYVAFEDGTANASGWSNDGDYNDYVFFFTGITCAGAGEPCDVPLAEGICAQGLTQCDGADLDCIPVNVSGPEVCDGLDNNCDGMVDNGNLCTNDEICTNGRCIGRCEEFGCGDPDLTCDDVTGECYEAACENVTCPSGEVCREGDCVGPCEGIVCPGEQICRVGACVDACAGVTCGAMKVCSGGICVDTCACSGCGQDDNGDDLTCEVSSGSCVDPQCVDVTCATGLFCSPTTGTCVDACTGAVCPDGQMCTMGACIDIPPVEPVDGGTNPDGGGNNPDGGGNGDGGSNDGGGEDGGGRRPPVSSGCGCRVPAHNQDAPLGLALAVFALPFLLRRRRR